MRPYLASLLIGLLGGPAVQVQTAPTSPVVKQWPVDGAWRVLLVQMQPAATAGLACLLVTGGQATRPSNPMSWALRYSKRGLVIIESSTEVGDATIPDFTLAIDGQTQGTFAITDRLQTPDHVPSVVTYVSAVAPVTDVALGEYIVVALRPGSAIRIERRGRAIEEVLDANDASSFEACRRDLVR